MDLEMLYRSYRRKQIDRNKQNDFISFKKRQGRAERREREREREKHATISGCCENFENFYLNSFS